MLAALIAMLAIASTSHSQNPASALRFVENKGQVDERACFTAQAGGVAAFIGEGGFVLQVVTDERDVEGPTRSEHVTPHERERPLVTRTGYNLAFTFVDADRASTPTGLDQLPGLYHYLTTNDRSRWTRHVRSFATVRFDEVWDGIGLDLTERDGRLEFDVLLEPRADLSSAVLRCQGADAMHLAPTGELVLGIGAETVRLSAPITWEVADDGTHVPLESEYVLHSDETFGFVVPDWSGERPLCIDPGLPFGTYLGSSVDDVVRAIDVDDAGDVYATGKGGDPADFPTTPGAFQTDPIGGRVSFVTKLDPTLSTLRYSTFVTGSLFVNEAQDIVVDEHGSAHVCGYTESTDFPTTGTWGTQHQGERDAYVYKLTSDGSDLVFSKLFGGKDNDFFYGIALADDGSVVVTGRADDLYPTTPGAFIETPYLFTHAVVSRISADGSLLASTLLPATEAHAIAIDTSGDPVVGGKDFGDMVPTPGAADPVYSGPNEGFVIRLAEDLSTLVYATFVGGGNNEELYGLALDSAGRAYVTGLTRSPNFPTTPDAEETFIIGNSDAFLSIIEPDGSAFAYSSFLGGHDDDWGWDVAVHPDGSAVVVGHTDSLDLPVTPDAPMLSLSGEQDAFVLHIEPGVGPRFATYIGGDETQFHQEIDVADSVALTSTGSLYVGGATTMTDFPTHAGAAQPDLLEREDGFVSLLTLTPWLEVGSGLDGVQGTPSLHGEGALDAGSSGQIALSSAAPDAPTTLIVGLSTLEAPLKTGVLVPAPDIVLALTTSQAGEIVIPWSQWPSGIPSGLTIYFQAWIQDAAAPKNWAASNALLAITP